MVEVLKGFSRNNGYWEYSQLAIDVLKEYKQKYPMMIKWVNNYCKSAAECNLDKALIVEIAEWVRQFHKE